MKVIKRNGIEVNFDMDKIYRAIANAMEDAGEYHANNLIQAILISKEIQDIVEEGGVAVTVEEIQDMVERTLMAKNLFDVARKYIIYRDQRSKERDKIWEMTDLQRDIYEKKYRHNEESFSEFLDRVSAGNTYVRKLMQKKKFLPAGRILANRGLNEIGKKVCYSNCFVNKPPEDNLESIFEVAGQMARTYSYGGKLIATL